MHYHMHLTLCRLPSISGFWVRVMSYVLAVCNDSPMAQPKGRRCPSSLLGYSVSAEPPLILRGGLSTYLFICSPTFTLPLSQLNEKTTKRFALHPTQSQAAALSLKRRAENALRGTGLGYTIVRPGPLLEEPGGYKALVFDQASPTLRDEPYLLPQEQPESCRAGRTYV